ncbi:hypothetical protein DXT77_04095 [Pseudomonas sp. 91RF]|jgi:hypothetical protein|uniref:hypothetical protein n=1 Tax=Pseudomonas sp. 91RF TaxID=2292261 RepID=UPI000E673D79|nr:hypothetical protein [Pseudomonas sp. 91RF]RIJ12658.1 hypothetical protein DXT77_04095 [Pseudomonas sp. 91RF]
MQTKKTKTEQYFEGEIRLVTEREILTLTDVSRSEYTDGFGGYFSGSDGKHSIWLGYPETIDKGKSKDFSYPTDFSHSPHIPWVYIENGKQHPIKSGEITVSHEPDSSYEGSFRDLIGENNLKIKGTFIIKWRK